MTNARAFTDHLAALLRSERASMADFLVALADFDDRRVWADLGHANLFAFLHRELGLSLGAAHYRKVAAGLVRRYPDVLAALRDGRLCLTTVVELAKVLTPENQAEVLPRFFHRSRREAKELSAELSPRPAPVREVITKVAAAPVDGCPPITEVAAAPVDVRPTMTRVAAAPVGGSPPTARVAAAQLDNSPPTDSILFQPVGSLRPDHGISPPRTVAPAERPRDGAEPVTADLRRLHVTVSRRFTAKLDAARDALSHARPGATLEQILEAGLDALLAQHAKRRGLVAKPRNTVRPTKSGAIPAAVKRAAWLRAGGRCEWSLESGEPCGSTTRLEYDHVVPRTHGGAGTIDNVRVLCGDHNDLAARRVFGDAWMDRCRKGDATSSRRAVPSVKGEPTCGSGRGASL